MILCTDSEEWLMLGYNADQNLDVFSCCVPSHLYLYLKGATNIKEAMENIKRACALSTPAPVETNTTPTVPFMTMNDRQDRQPLKTVSFKEEGAQDKINDGLEKLSQILDKQLQLAEKQSNDSGSRGRRRERRDSRDRRSRSYDRSSSYDHRTGQRAERDQIVEIEVGIEVVETKVEIKIQETRGTIQVLDIPQVCFVIIAK